MKKRYTEIVVKSEKKIIWNGSAAAADQKMNKKNITKSEAEQIQNKH